MERSYARGMRVIVRDYRGARLERRVWGDSGLGIMLCTEDAYQQAVRYGVEPLAAGFPKDSVVEVRPLLSALKSTSG